jgi:hypothetical protein
VAESTNAVVLLAFVAFVRGVWLALAVRRSANRTKQRDIHVTVGLHRDTAEDRTGEERGPFDANCVSRATVHGRLCDRYRADDNARTLLYVRARFTVPARDIPVTGWLRSDHALAAWAITSAR